MSEGLRFDHVIWGTRDLDAAAAWLADEYDMDVGDGGVHPGGTCNKTVRFLDGSYLELLAVADPAGPIGSVLERIVEDGDRLVGWAVHTSDIDAVARRLGTEIHEGSITLQDGSVGRWRTTAVGYKTTKPFVIQYEATDTRNERFRDGLGEDAPAGIAWVELSDDGAAARDVLGDADLDVRVVDGRAGLSAVGIRAASGEIVIRNPK